LADETPRAELIEAFLADQGLSHAEREPLVGDASTRSYVRLRRPDGPALMLMDAPPAAESAPCPPHADAHARRAAGYNALARLSAGRVDAFVAAARWLRELGLSAPEVVAFDASQGLALLEDLGDGLYARRMEAGETAEPLYAAAIDVLTRLHQASAPSVLPLHGRAAWPLLTYDALALQTGADLFLEWRPRFSGLAAFDDAARAEWRALWAPIERRGQDGARVFAHRDYHAENLIWLPHRFGLARVGLLDFQDALCAHPAWDLLSLLQDARRDVEPAMEAAMLQRYLASRPDLDAAAFRSDYAGLAALNNARITGLFARLIVRDGKPRYRAFLPRMERLLARNLAHPDMAGLRAWFARHAPLEARA
jgi:aminoglycoside/choline kinase family phosphotransferase